MVTKSDSFPLTLQSKMLSGRASLMGIGFLPDSNSDSGRVVMQKVYGRLAAMVCLFVLLAGCGGGGGGTDTGTGTDTSTQHDVPVVDLGTDKEER